MTSMRSPDDGNLTDLLTQARKVILSRTVSEQTSPQPCLPGSKLRVGVDLGTAYLVLVVLDESGDPIAGEWQFAQVVRDGLVVDFSGATNLLSGMKKRVERRIGRQLNHAASGFPPGIPLVEVRATANVLEAAGLSCSSMLDEPSAANNLLHQNDGAIVDVGGGTTGIAILRNGCVIHTADEATGGTHFSLVLSGALGMSFEDAEELKLVESEQPRLFPLVRPVMEKVGNIIQRHVRGRNVDRITLVGGCSAFMGMAEVIQEYTGIETWVPPEPMLITPLGLALADPVN